MLLVAALAGCSTAPPPLPSDTTSINRARSATLGDFPPQDRALTCDDIATQRRAISAAMQADTSQIEGNRTRNQVAGYFGALFILPAFATESNTSERDDIGRLYGRRDTLIKLAALKDCPAVSASPS